MKLRARTLVASAAIIVAGLTGGLVLSTSAGATTPPVYEVVTANPATTPATWLTVQGPFTKTQADAVLARLNLQKAAICRLGLPACKYTYREYQLVTPA